MSITEHDRTGARHRVRFDFRGELEDVPFPEGVATAAAVRELLGHVDTHRGRPAVVRVEHQQAGVRLTLLDPECSPACVARARGRALADGEVDLGTAQHGGLRLTWAPVRGR